MIIERFDSVVMGSEKDLLKVSIDLIFHTGRNPISRQTNLAIYLLNICRSGVGRRPKLARVEVDPGRGPRGGADFRKSMFTRAMRLSRHVSTRVRDTWKCRRDTNKKIIPLRSFHFAIETKNFFFFFCISVARVKFVD